MTEAVIGALVVVLGAVLTGGVQAGSHWLLAHRPHRVDNPGDTAPDVPEWGTYAAALERVPASVRDEFLPPAGRVDQRTLAAGGLLLLPDNVYVDQSAVVPMVIRTSDPGAVRVLPAAQPPPTLSLPRRLAALALAPGRVLGDLHGRAEAQRVADEVRIDGRPGFPPGWRRGRGPGEPHWVPLVPVRSSIPEPPPVRRSLAAEAARIRREAYQQLLHDQAAARRGGQVEPPARPSPTRAERR